MITSGKLGTHIIQYRTFHLGQKRSSAIRQITPDNQAGTTDAVEVLRALNKVTRSRAPNPPVFYKTTSFAVCTSQPVHQSGTDQVIPINLHHVLGIPC